MENLILLHGALGAKSQLEPIKKNLEGKLKVYSLNFEGHGGRPLNSEFSIDTFSQNLIDFMSNEGIESSSLFGYSMGGYVALNTALKFPDKVEKIITLGTKFSWTPESANEEIKSLNAEKMEENIPKHAAYIKFLHQPLDWVEVMANTARFMDELGHGACLSTADFGAIRHECYIGLGDQDEMVTKEETQKIADVVANGTYYELEDSPHPINRINPQKIVSKIFEIFELEEEAE